MGKEITIHRIDKNNTILDVPYSKYVNKILDIFDKNQTK